MVTAWSLLAVGLAQVGLFRWWAVLAISLIACASGGAFWRFESRIASSERRDTLFLLPLLGLALLLFARPAEHFPQIGDSSIYPNTASKLIDTGGLTYHYGPLDGLASEQKQLFYVPSDEQLSHVDIESYEGLLYGAYYMMDPSQNTIVASRPPVATTWMGLFGLLAGPPGMLYVTPLFGTAGLVAVYFLGKRLFDAGAGALASIWLLISFPQLHFSRTPHAEVMGQFFALTTLYALVVYLKRGSRRHVVLGAAAWTAGFAARLDVILLVPTLLLFVLFLALRRDGKALGAWVASAAIAVAFTLWTVNRPYVGATWELLLRGQLRFLRQMSAHFLAVAGLASLSGLVGLRELLRYLSPHRRETLIRLAVLIVVVAGVGYALHIRPLRPEYRAVGDEMVAAHNEELMAVAAQYVSYPFFWLAALGMILLFWRQPIGHDRLLFAFFVLFFAAGFLWKYTTARVYPVALRRLVPEVLPGCALLGAFAIRRLAHRGPRWKWSGVALAGLVAVLLLSVTGRYWFHRGAEGAWSTVDQLANGLPSDAVIIFEPQTEGVVVGWFAAPLWSFHQRRAMLPHGGDPDAAVLREAICFWQNQDRDIFVVSQHAPPSWWPGKFGGEKEGEVTWNSSIIGQSLKFPPYVWRFSFTFSIYRLADVSCSGR
jgi:4-amino-4-deoxy-L-arabinose transferase-like glycosyltransferase